MKRLHDLRKQLPSNARLNINESTTIKGGADKKTGDRPSGDLLGPIIDTIGGLFG